MGEVSKSYNTRVCEYQSAWVGDCVREDVYTFMCVLVSGCGCMFVLIYLRDFSVSECECKCVKV